MMMTALYVFLGLVGLVVLGVFSIPIFLPKNYSIEKTITINAPADVIYDKVADLNQYRDWNPWSQMEPEASKTVSGTPKTLGHRYEWRGNKIGTGSLTVKKVMPNKAVDIELAFIKPWKSIAQDNWTFAPEGNQTKVIWKNHGPLAYPTARLMGPFISKNLNQQFEVGLQNLKTLCER